MSSAVLSLPSVRESCKLYNMVNLLVANFDLNELGALR